MVRLRNRLVLGCAALLWLWAAKPLLAISPSVIMVYGQTLKEPILLRPTSPADFPVLQVFWWRAGRFDVPHTLQGNALVAGLGGRAYLKLAIFWGRFETSQLKPEDASQHGRLYLPTASDAAVVVVTLPRMVDPATGGAPPRFPIPGDLTGFNAAWSLSPQDLEIVRGLGIPGV